MFSPNSGNLKSEGPAGLEVEAAGVDAGGAFGAGEADGASRLGGRWGFGLRRLGLDGLCVGSLGFRACSIFHGEDHLADFDLLAFLNANFVDRAGHGRWDFDDGLVGFQFHDGLALGDARAERDHQPHQITLVNIFAEFRKLEFCH